jgi:hypothetical protein
VPFGRDGCILHLVGGGRRRGARWSRGHEASVEAGHDVRDGVGEVGGCGGWWMGAGVRMGGRGPWAAVGAVRHESVRPAWWVVVGLRFAVFRLSD